VINSEGVRLGEEAARRLARSGQYEIGLGLTDKEFARIERDSPTQANLARRDG
jgi:hypothetical protein